MKYILTLISLMLYSSVLSQVFLLQDGTTKPWAGSDLDSKKEYSESFERLEATIKSIQQEEVICIVDSLVLNIKINSAGNIFQSAVLNALSSRHLERIEEALQTCRFAPNQSLDLICYFPPKHKEPSIFDLEKTPVNGSCWRNGEQGNLLFDVACFNYHVTENVFKTLNKLRHKDQKEEGPLTGTVWFDKHGEIEQVALNPICFNPRLNDLAAKSLSSLKVKKGASIGKQPSGFRVDFQVILLISDRTDTTAIVQEAERMFNRNNLDSALFNYVLSKTLGGQLSNNELKKLGYAYYVYNLNSRAQDTWQNIKPDLLPGQKLQPVQQNDSIILIPEKVEDVVFPVNFKNCSTSDLVEAYSCFFDSISAFVQKELNYSPTFTQMPFEVQVNVECNSEGQLDKVYLTKFSSSKKSNLLVLKALCRLPNLVPASKNTIQVPFSFTVPIHFHPPN